jgi:hypothetical protein
VEGPHPPPATATALPLRTAAAAPAFGLYVIALYYCDIRPTTGEKSAGGGTGIAARRETLHRAFCESEAVRRKRFTNVSATVHVK